MNTNIDLRKKGTVHNYQQLIALVELQCTRDTVIF